MNEEGRETCSRCGGSGSLSGVRCKKCKGTGRIPLDNPWGYQWEKNRRSDLIDE